MPLAGPTRCSVSPTPPSITSEQRKRLHECFALMDEDGNGLIDETELGSALSLLGVPASSPEVKIAFEAADWDKSGMLDWNEFQTAMTTVIHRLAAKKSRQLQQIFRSTSPQGARLSADGSSGVQTEDIPFDYTLQEYRRRRLLQLFSNSLQKRRSKEGEKRGLRARPFQSLPGNLKQFLPQLSRTGSYMHSRADIDFVRERTTPGYGRLLQQMDRQNRDVRNMTRNDSMAQHPAPSLAPVAPELRWQGSLSRNLFNHANSENLIPRPPSPPAKGSNLLGQQGSLIRQARNAVVKETSDLLSAPPKDDPLDHPSPRAAKVLLKLSSKRSPSIRLRPLDSINDTPRKPTGMLPRSGTLSRMPSIKISE